MNQETILLFAKDFFGEAVDAKVSFLQGGRVALSARFSDGVLALKIPEHLEPGLYDVLAERDTASYRIDSFFVPLASDIFRHAHLHADLRLKGDNLSGPPIERHKVDPILYSYLSRVGPGLPSRLDRSVTKTGESPGLRRGGRVVLSDGRLIVSAGEAYVGGRLVSWGDLSYDLRDLSGEASLGVSGGRMLLDGSPKELEVARLSIDAQDWVRLRLLRHCHPLYRSGSLYYLERVLRDSGELRYGRYSGYSVEGRVYGGEVYGEALCGRRVSEVSLSVRGIGPVLSTDRLYLYAEPDYLLLWEGSVLIGALPRYPSGRVRLAWDREGVSLFSTGDDGEVSLRVAGSYDPSAVRFMSGPGVRSLEEDIPKKRYGMAVLASASLEDWSVRHRSDTASLFWGSQDISAQTIPSDDLFPSEDLLPQ